MTTRRLRSVVGLLAVLCVGVASPAFAQLDGAITAPGANATVMQPFTIKGWAVHKTPGTVGTGIDIVRVFGCTETACTLWGTATYGEARPAVATLYGQQYLNSGYSFTKAGLTPGPIYLKVEARSTVNGAWYIWGYSINVQAGPEHTLELPANNAVLSGAVSVKGWAIDASAPSGTGVNLVRVRAARNYGSGQPLKNYGDATYGANRPDVVATHGTRFRYSGYTGTFTLPSGQLYLQVLARSSHTQVWTTRTRTIYVDMATVPLTIDRPGTGTGSVTASGLSCPGGSTTQALPCGASYALHTARTLTAVPDPGSSFAGWGGACSGTGTCQVTLSMARYVTASFTKLPATIDTRYYHTDPIGSVRAITDETGAVVIRHDYRPFGEDVQPLTGDPMRFAGKELDEETGQQYFDARYYRNTWGRFTTVDPYRSPHALTEPQRWNRYAYAGNNPLKYVDPSGLDYGVCSGNSCGFHAVPFSAIESWAQQSGFDVKGSVDAGLFLNSNGTEVGDYYYYCGVICDQGPGLGAPGPSDPGDPGGGGRPPRDPDPTDPCEVTPSACGSPVPPPSPPPPPDGENKPPPGRGGSGNGGGGGRTWHPSDPNGCGPTWFQVPDGAFGYNFRPSCNAHDICYGTNASSGALFGKTRCDAVLGYDLLLAVQSQSNLRDMVTGRWHGGMMAGGIYAVVTYVGGGWAYHESK